MFIKQVIKIIKVKSFTSNYKTIDNTIHLLSALIVIKSTKYIISFKWSVHTICIVLSFDHGIIWFLNLIYRSPLLVPGVKTRRLLELPVHVGEETSEGSSTREVRVGDGDFVASCFRIVKDRPSVVSDLNRYVPELTCIIIIVVDLGESKL